jgi:hypothetical protein
MPYRKNNEEDILCTDVRCVCSIGHISNLYVEGPSISMANNADTDQDVRKNITMAEQHCATQ